MERWLLELSVSVVGTVKLDLKVGKVVDTSFAPITTIET